MIALCLARQSVNHVGEKLDIFSYSDAGAIGEAENTSFEITFKISHVFIA